MDLREKTTAAVKDAMRARDSARLSTLRLISAAIKDRDIDARGEGKDAISDADITVLLAKMVRQRQESASVYDSGNRPELAAKERAEIAVIEEFLPRQLDSAEVEAAIAAAIAATEAASLRDMGRIMDYLRVNYAGQMDFGKAGAIIKAQLNG
ncbi:GatB/YqeY domain-containing protein [Ketogulonicigenium vulgare]|uniref:Aspartyl/glutamyl-tRNA(Asn/Gln) amidotransferase subunit B n=1 Tax=Ketogulonicigenium vulgare (strain WSH-001) TaxID=759362 RepID=F9Y3B5_KETVW|nr:GatB/YqeY domain-containing protein [Ketogulonicigenium vulgare]ADO42152.1 GatB/YqeY [Ketogulonicigenium vulgare Y25]AEM40356.1 Aspartyl/glutamyl-tRNA(Asn/Gln) amidotransferase subunit B [Ketogulonicigenium vulgare WSH-001]ALJ82271.1 glutamyl-tRNA amidotransferase [Ketogulonicigenium vulgare]ANW34941.1 glutamyl-tRNA amidotransferase [Ketogulonicigenium vulgare]AOZ54069.1 GatB/YqeY [Ketogulonicigenium vulgare]